MRAYTLSSRRTVRLPSPYFSGSPYLRRIPYFLFCKSIPVFGIVAVLLNDNIAAAVSGCGRHSSPHAQPLGPGQRHGRRPCGTGSRRSRFVRRGQPAAAAVPFHIAPRARRVATSDSPAERLSHLGAEGHAFFFRRISPVMRQGCGQSVPKPCSSPGLGPMCMTWCPRSLARS